MTFSEWVTYVILPALIGLGGLIKSGFPKYLAARLRGDEETRKHQQKIDELSHAYYHSEREVTNQALASVVATSQDKEEKANEFIRTVVFNSLDKIKTDTNHIPILVGEIKALQSQVNGLETRQRLLIDLITGGLITVGDDQRTGDYDTWKKQQPQTPTADA